MTKTKTYTLSSKDLPRKTQKKLEIEQIKTKVKNLKLAEEKKWKMNISR